MEQDQDEVEDEEVDLLEYLALIRLNPPLESQSEIATVGKYLPGKSDESFTFCHRCCCALLTYGNAETARDGCSEGGSRVM